MTKLNQIIAVEKDVKSQGVAALTHSHHLLQKQPLLSGIVRTYKPKNDDGDWLPAESTRVQVRADGVIKAVTIALTRMFDVVATKETTNTQASADVVVNDRLLLADVPVTVLLFLEKQLTDLNTFVRKLPVLDPSENWSYNDAYDCYATDATATTRTKKEPRNHEKSPATDRHPAQVEMWFEDVVVGTWTTMKFSSALPAKRVAELLERVETLERSVKMAREEANNVEVIDRNIGRAVFDYLFA